MRALAVGLALASLASCAPGWLEVSRRVAASEPAAGAADEVPDRRRTYYDRQATRPRSETGWLLRGDGRSLKHGLERRWYENGQLEYERHWERDQPSGLWRSWFEDGSPRFEYAYDPAQATRMRWWHASGAVSSAGPARSGVREGLWRGNHPDGSRAFEGYFEAGRREDFWLFWYPDGSLETSGSYLRGDRIGTWENYAPGVHFEEPPTQPAAATAPGGRR